MGGVGAVSSIAGVCLAPFTAGLSLFLTGYGVVTTIAGTSISVGAEIYHSLKSKGFHEIIKYLSEQHDKVATELSETVKEIKEIVEELENNYKYDLDTAIFATLKSGGIGITKTIKTADAVKKAARAIQIAKALKSTISGGTKSIKFFFWVNHLLQ